MAADISKVSTGGILKDELLPARWHLCSTLQILLTSRCWAFEEQDHFAVKHRFVSAESVSATFRVSSSLWPLTSANMDPEFWMLTITFTQPTAVSFLPRGKRKWTQFKLPKFERATNMWICTSSTKTIWYEMKIIPPGRADLILNEVYFAIMNTDTDRTETQAWY